MEPKPAFSAHLHGQIESLDQGGWTSCRKTWEAVFPFHQSENYLLTTTHILELKLASLSPLKIQSKHLFLYRIQIRDKRKLPTPKQCLSWLDGFLCNVCSAQFSRNWESDTDYLASPSLWTHILLACCFQFAGWRILEKDGGEIEEWTVKLSCFPSWVLPDMSWSHRHTVPDWAGTLEAMTIYGLSKTKR